MECVFKQCFNAVDVLERVSKQHSNTVDILECDSKQCWYEYPYNAVCILEYISKIPACGQYLHLSLTAAAATAATTAADASNICSKTVAQHEQLGTPAIVYSCLLSLGATQYSHGAYRPLRNRIHIIDDRSNNLIVASTNRI
jgi:hypothetical protein